MRRHRLLELNSGLPGRPMKPFVVLYLLAGVVLFGSVYVLCRAGDSEPPIHHRPGCAGRDDRGAL